MATDLLARIREELDERMAALRPLLSEYERLLEAADTLAAVAGAELTPLDGLHPAAPSTGESSALAPSEERLSTGERFSTREPMEGEPTEGDEPTEDEPTTGKPSAGKPSGEEPSAETHSEEEPSAEKAPDGEPTAETAPSTLTRRRGRPPRGSPAGAFGLAMSLRTTPPIQPIARKPTTAATRESPAPRPSATEPAEWLTPMPGASPTDAPLLSAHGAAEANNPSTSLAEDTARRREPVSPAAAQQAILAALEHGSHTPGELVMVTAMTPGEVRGNLGRLARRGAVSKVKRDGDGKAAYALPSASARA